MKGKYFLILGVFVLVMLSVFVAAVPSWKIVSCPIDSDTDIVFYGYWVCVERICWRG